MADGSASGAALRPPRLMLPEAEAAALRAAYARADAILEYGSGGSTVLAGSLPGRSVVSVESDAAWAAEMRAWFALHPPVRPVAIHHADIGPTRAWGRPDGPGAWRRFHHYPLSVWDREGFAHPDVVLIDGRFRLACFLATLFRIERPAIVLWDDYADRPAYRAAERYARPVVIAGRMARFDLSPVAPSGRDLSFILDAFARVQ